MARLMSVFRTTEQVKAHTKTVTRRLGWQFLKPGDRLTLCRKVMGRKSGEPVERLAEVRVVNVRREPLSWIDGGDVAREGFPGWTPAQFQDFFIRHMRCSSISLVTRIEWEYLDGEG